MPREEVGGLICLSLYGKTDIQKLPTPASRAIVIVPVEWADVASIAERLSAQ